MIERAIFAANQKNEIMYSSEDLERFRKKIVEVKVDGIPVEGSGETETEPNGRFPNVSQTKDKSVRIWVDIRISNGLHLSQKNLSYQDLVRMIEKLEGLC